MMMGMIMVMMMVMMVMCMIAQGHLRFDAPRARPWLGKQTLQGSKRTWGIEMLYYNIAATTSAAISAPKSKIIILYQ
jgi:hypothetical protein